MIAAADFDDRVHAVVEVLEHRADHEVAAGTQKRHGLDAVLRERQRRDEQHRVLTVDRDSRKGHAQAEGGKREKRI